MDNRIVGVVAILALCSMAFADVAKPLDVFSRSPEGEYGRCETTGWYVFLGGMANYATMVAELNYEIALRMARGMV